MKLNFKSIVALALVVAGLVLLVIGITTLVNLRQDVGQAVARIFVERTDRETTAIILTVLGGAALVVGVVLLVAGGGKKKRKKRT